MSDGPLSEILGLTAKIVSAHVTNNQIDTEALPGLIQSVYHSLATVGEVEVKAEAQAPAVPVRKSVFPRYIICLEDGKKLKMLKRHLKTSYNMTPDEYRTNGGCRVTIRWWRQSTPRIGRRWPRKAAWEISVLVNRRSRSFQRGGRRDRRAK